MRDPFALGTRLQHGRATVCCLASDDDRHAPTLDERAPLDGPALSEITQDSGQRIEPRIDPASEATPEAQPQFRIKFGDAGCSHLVSLEAAARSRDCGCSRPAGMPWS